MGKRGLRVWQNIIVIFALLSVPSAIYISSHYRNAENEKLCIATQHNWDTEHALIIRFTAPGSRARIDALAIEKARPQC